MHSKASLKNNCVASDPYKAIHTMYFVYFIGYTTCIYEIYKAFCSTIL